MDLKPTACSGDRYRLYRNGQCRQEGHIAEFDGQALAGGDLIWASIVRGDQTLADALAHRLHFEILSASFRDAIPGSLRDRGECLAMVVSAVENGDAEKHETSVVIGIGRQFVVSRGMPSLESAWLQRVDARTAELTKGPGFLLTAALDAVAAPFGPAALALEARAVDLEQRAATGPLGRDALNDVIRLQHELIDFGRKLAANLHVLDALARDRFETIDVAAQPYFRDIGDHLRSVEQIVVASRKAIASLTMLSAAPAADNDRTVRALSAWAVLFALLTSCTALFSMNFAGIPGISFTLGYLVFVLVVGAACGAIFLLLHGRRWI